MTDEELAAAEAKAPAAAPASGGSLTDDQVAAADDKVAPGGLTGVITGKSQPGKAEAIGRGAVQGASLGFGDEISAGIDALLSHVPGVRTVAEKINLAGGEGAGLPVDDPNITYAKRRDSYRAANADAQQAHPLLYGGAALAGGVATAAGAPATLGRFGLTRAAAAAEAATGGGKLGAGLGTAMDRALVSGGVAGLGTSEAKTVPGMASDTVTGAATAAATAGALHGLGAGLAKRAPGAFEKDIDAEIFSKADRKTGQPAIEFQKANPAEFKEIAYSPEFKPVQEAIRAGKTDQAVGAIEKFNDKAGANRLANYDVIDKSGYQVTPGPVVDRMDKLAAAKAATSSPEEAKALKDAADRVRNEFSTVDVNQLKAGDTQEGVVMAKLAPYLPQRGTITKAEFQDAATKLARAETGNPKANYGDVANDVHGVIEQLPFSYNANAPVSIVQLRKAATAAQNATHATLGSIAETEHYRIVNGVDQAINAGLAAHLDGAAKTSPAVAQAVERIRHDNKILSMGLSMQTALEQRLEKEARGKVLTTGQKVKGALVGTAALGAEAGYLLHSPVAAGAVAAAPLVGIAARHGQDLLARTLMAAKQGNPWAVKTIQALAGTRAGAARLAAMQPPGASAEVPAQ